MSESKVPGEEKSANANASGALPKSESREPVAQDAPEAGFDTHDGALENESTGTGTSNQAFVLDAFRESEKRYRELFENMQEGFLIQELIEDDDGNPVDVRYVDVNPAMERFLGKPRSEIIGKPRNVVLGVPDPEVVAANYRVVTTGQPAHLIRYSSGAKRWYESFSYSFGAKLVATLVMDITDRTLAELKLRQSEVKFRSLFESLTDGILVMGLDGSFIDVNNAAHSRLGYTKQEMLALDVRQLDAPAFAPRVSERMAQVREHGVAVFESAHLRKDGTVMPVEINARVIDYEWKPAYLSVVRDITARKDAEQKILQSERFVRSILDTVDEGFIVVDRDFRILTANEAYCSQAGASSENVISRHCYELSHKLSRPCHECGEECAVHQALETGKPHMNVHVHRDADDNIVYVETKAFPVRDATDPITSVIETINDITEKHLLEEERLKTQKLESIGTLAGGIAHDFNNLLQGVFGYVSMAKRSAHDPDRVLEMLEQAEQALSLSVGLATQLLTFAKGGKPVRKRVDLRPVIENATRFALSGSRTEHRLAFADGLWAAEVDEGQISQVIQNVVLNAREAMPEGGTVEVCATNLDIPEGSTPAHPGGGKFVRVTVTDHGVGIPSEQLSRVFDPYFTTKEKGSGLGLATSYSIVKNHGGALEAVSQPGKGSTFVITLPAAKPTEARAARQASHAVAREPKGRILVMDDEPLVRAVVRKMVQGLGHEVEVARHGQEAVERYAQALAQGRRFDAVILDLTIRAGMGGEEAMRRLKALDPNVVAVVSSGYSGDPVVSEYRSHGFRDLLNKPYSYDKLKECLGKLLRG